MYYGYGRVNVLEAAKCVKKVSGAKPLPEPNSFYIDQPLTVTTPADNAKVYLYEVLPDNSLFPQGVSISHKTKDNKFKTFFYGLKDGVNYRIISYVDSVLKEHNFTASKAVIMEHTFN